MAATSPGTGGNGASTPHSGGPPRPSLNRLFPGNQPLTGISKQTRSDSAASQRELEQVCKDAPLTISDGRPLRTAVAVSGMSSIGRNLQPANAAYCLPGWRWIRRADDRRSSRVEIAVVRSGWTPAGQSSRQSLCISCRWHQPSGTRAPCASPRSLCARTYTPFFARFRWIPRPPASLFRWRRMRTNIRRSLQTTLLELLSSRIPPVLSGFLF